MADKFTMKETNVENLIIYDVSAKDFPAYQTKDRVMAYKVFNKLKKYGYNDIVLKKVTTNVETEYLERG